jgi:effector-binding domain-containing protein/uncharacterized protein YndB with AHSA1/START domain
MIFVATQKGEFTVEKSKIINAPRSDVFNYINDSKNWEDWSSIVLDDSGISVTHSQNTIGKGSFYSWKGKEGSGDVQTINVKENDSIIQKMNYNGNNSDVFMSFKDTLGGTKVTWKAKGEMSFGYKLMTIYHGGATNFIGLLFEKSLANLDKKLDYEMNTFSVKVNGLATIPADFYLAQTFMSEISKVEKNSEIVFKKITAFCKKNKIAINGKPFNIFHTYDSENGLTKISICIPIKNQILLAEGSDIISGKFESKQAIKTTLTGDYSHIKEAVTKTLEYIIANQLVTDPTFSHLEVYYSGKKEIKTPSKWLTEIYIPLKPIATNTATVIKPLDTTISTKKEVTPINPKIVSSKKETVVPTPKKVKAVTTPKIITTPKKLIPVTTPKIEKEIPSEF